MFEFVRSLTSTRVEVDGNSPSYQRRGAASLQLSWTVGLADEKGLACWVEASPMSVPLYKNFGFEVQDEVVCQRTLWQWHLQVYLFDARAKDWNFGPSFDISTIN